MKLSCPNSQCSSTSRKIQKDGKYFRSNDSRFIQRFRCGSCGKRFSKSTFELEYRQKKRRINNILLRLFASGISMNRSALILNIHPITVKRKFIYLAIKARKYHDEFLSNLSDVMEMQFDDLLTIEHTKLKPLTVSCAVDSKSRILLDAHVAPIPASGHLAKISREKYGKRENRHWECLNNLFKQITPCLSQEVIIKSDKHKLYPKIVKKYCPDATHLTYKGGRGCITGQGELKKKAYDPIFTLNHCYAMLRANINRLFRKTWCTTKDPQMLKNHLDIFIYYYNTSLI